MTVVWEESVGDVVCTVWSQPYSVVVVHVHVGAGIVKEGAGPVEQAEQEPDMVNLWPGSPFILRRQPLVESVPPVERNSHDEYL